MAEKNINSSISDADGNLLPNIILQDGFTHYDGLEIKKDPTATEGDRSKLAGENLLKIYTEGVPQSGARVPSDSPHGPNEIVAKDPKGQPVLMRPSGTDERGNITYEVSTEPIYGQSGNIIDYRVRRPVFTRPNVVRFHADPTDASRKTAEHMDHAANVRDASLSEARILWLITRSYVNPEGLGIKDETRPMYDSTGRLVAADPTNPELRSFNQLTHPEKLRMYLATGPNSQDAKLVRSALARFEKAMEKGTKYHAIVQNHGHHKVAYKPWTWNQGGHGHGHDEHGHDHDPAHPKPTPLEAAQKTANEALDSFQADATPADLIIFDNLVTLPDVNIADRHAAATGRPLVTQKMELAVNAVGQLKRHIELETLNADLKTAITSYVNGKPSRHDKRIFTEAGKPFEMGDAIALERLANTANISHELKTALLASAAVVRIQQNVERGAERVETRIKINTEADRLKEDFEKAKQKFYGTSPEPGVLKDFNDYFAKTPAEIEAYVASVKGTKVADGWMINLLEKAAKMKRALER
ncbi:MAG: hypothetical protein JWO47_988 [Candidatus Saccharibacteria bacterium]|nr:hypothetical protein [Candidatus Saccharibacteria bacterium]